MPYPPNILERAKPLRLVIFDVDGVLTDGRLYYTDAGEQCKAFHVHDGSAIKLLLSNGIEVAIISGRESASVTRRATELGIRHVYQGVQDKVTALAALSHATHIAPAQMAHVGDDLPDIGLFAKVGLAIAVADGHRAAREAANFVTDAAGGRGAAADVCRLILTAQDKWPYGQPGA